MLWTLLVLISSADFLAGAIMAAKERHAGLGGYVLSVIIGLILFALNFWTLEKTSQYFVHRIQPFSERAQEWLFRLLYACVFLWGFLAVLIGERIATNALRIFHLI